MNDGIANISPITGSTTAITVTQIMTRKYLRIFSTEVKISLNVSY